jgi:hypothetical protein
MSSELQLCIEANNPFARLGDRTRDRCLAVHRRSFAWPRPNRYRDRSGTEARNRGVTGTAGELPSWPVRDGCPYARPRKFVDVELPTACAERSVRGKELTTALTELHANRPATPNAAKDRLTSCRRSPPRALGRGSSAEPRLVAAIFAASLCLTAGRAGPHRGLHLLGS